jgi:hypothetical protein
MFIFAESYGITRLRQDAVDRLTWCLNRAAANVADPTVFLAPSRAIRVYEHTQPRSVLRKLVAIAYCVLSDKSKVVLPNHPKDYLVDILQYREEFSPESFRPSYLDLATFTNTLLRKRRKHARSG